MPRTRLSRTALLVVAIAVVAGLVMIEARAQDRPAVPNFWDLRARMERPDPETLRPIRFMTSPDFKPLNFLDRRGALIGFNIDLARAVCGKLDIACAVQHRPYGTLVAALKTGEGDAIIAGLSPGRSADSEVAFTRPYLKIPARFAGPRPWRWRRPSPPDRRSPRRRRGGGPTPGCRRLRQRDRSRVSA